MWNGVQRVILTYYKVTGAQDYRKAPQSMFLYEYERYISSVYNTNNNNNGPYVNYYEFIFFTDLIRGQGGVLWVHTDLL